MGIESGYFFIPDITGYTRFLTQSELGHAKEILDAIFDSILEHVEPPLSVSKVEGDAIFCYVPDRLVTRPQSILEAMEATYFQFRRQLNLMDINTTCDCNACINMNELDLKIFIHHGEYILQEIAGGSEVAGADVILAHRMMKNSVREATGVNGYGMVTQAAIDAIGLTDTTDGALVHTEHYEDFGDVTSYIFDLHKAWETEAVRARIELTPETALVYAEAFVPVSPWIAWAYATDGETKKRYLGVDTHDRIDGDSQSRVGIGSAFHCAHQLGDIDYVITDIDAPYYFTTRNLREGVATLGTTRIVPEGEGSKIQFLFGTEGDRPPPVNIDDLQLGLAGQARALRDIIHADLESGAISKQQIDGLAESKSKLLRPQAADGRFADLQGLGR